MKKLVFLIVLAVAAHAYEPIDRAQTDEKFSMVAKERMVISPGAIRLVNSPFVIEKLGDKTGVTLTLQAIVQNRAKLSGKWYKNGDDVGAGFSIVRISNGVVGVSDMNVYKELNLKDNQSVEIRKK